MSEFGETLADNLSSRNMPYLTAVEPKNVANYEFDDSGKLKSFSSVSYTHLDVYKRQGLFGVGFEAVCRSFVVMTISVGVFTASEMVIGGDV